MTANSENHKIEDLVEEFLQDGRARLLADGTISFYSTHLTTFQTFLKTIPVVTIDQLSVKAVQSGILDRKDGRGSGGVHATYRAVRAFCNWYEGKAPEWPNPCKQLKNPKHAIDPIPPIERENIWKLIHTCGDDAYALRDRALIMALFDTGLRRRELLDIDVGDISFNQYSIKVNRGKTGNARVVFFGENTRAALLEYTRGRREDRKQPLWLNRSKDRLEAMGLREILRRRAGQAKLDDYPGCHDFRRAFAIAMLRAGVDLVRVQLLMGHKPTELIARYLAYTSADLRQAHIIGKPVDRLFEEFGKRKQKKKT